MTIEELERILTNPQDMGEVFLTIKEYGPKIYAVLKAAEEWRSAMFIPFNPEFATKVENLTEALEALHIVKS